MVVYLLWMLVTSFNATGVVLTDRLEGWNNAIAALALLLISPLFVALAGVALLLLWSMLVPVFDLPEIDLITAIAMSWLVGFLVRGMTPQTVRDVSPRG